MLRINATIFVQLETKYCKVVVKELRRFVMNYTFFSRFVWFAANFLSTFKTNGRKKLCCELNCCGEIKSEDIVIYFSSGQKI